MESVWDRERDHQNTQANRMEGNHDYAPHRQVAVPPTRRDQELACPMCAKLQADVAALVRVLKTLASLAE